MSRHGLRQRCLPCRKPTAGRVLPGPFLRSLPLGAEDGKCRVSFLEIPVSPPGRRREAEVIAPGEPHGGRAHSGPSFWFPGSVRSVLRPRDTQACLTSAEACLRMAVLRAGGQGQGGQVPSLRWVWAGHRSGPWWALPELLLPASRKCSQFLNSDSCVQPIHQPLDRSNRIQQDSL